LQQQQQVNIIVATMASKINIVAPPKGESITNVNAMVMGDTSIKPFPEKKFVSAVLFEYTVNLYDVFIYLGVIQFCQIATKEHIIQQMEDNDIMME